MAEGARESSGQSDWAEGVCNIQKAEGACSLVGSRKFCELTAGRLQIHWDGDCAACHWHPIDGKMHNEAVRATVDRPLCAAKLKPICGAGVDSVVGRGRPWLIPPAQPLRNTHLQCLLVTL